MLLLFCDNPLNPREPDEIYAPEFEAARRCGFDCRFISFESLTGGDVEIAPRCAALPEESRAWMEGTDMDRAWEITRPLAGGAMIVKDFVKSAKHKWDEGCFIPADAPREKFESVVSAFLRIRGDSFNRGLVFREFVDLMPVGQDVISGRTVFEEYRLFFWRGRLLRSATFDLEGGAWREFERWEEYARRFQSPFITIDVARQTDGRWIIVEAGMPV